MITLHECTDLLDAVDNALEKFRLPRRLPSVQSADLAKGRSAWERARDRIHALASESAPKRGAPRESPELAQVHARLHRLEVALEQAERSAALATCEVHPNRPAVRESRITDGPVCDDCAKNEDDMVAGRG